jgi:hypothetical protein
VGMTPEQRTQRARLAALTRWSREDPRPAAAIARRGADEKLRNEIDPTRSLPPEELERRVVAARRARMTKLALLSSQARARGSGFSETEPRLRTRGRGTRAVLSGERVKGAPGG